MSYFMWQHINSTLSHIAQHAVTKHPATEQSAILYNADYKNKNNPNCCAGFLCLKIAELSILPSEEFVMQRFKKKKKNKAWER